MSELHGITDWTPINSQENPKEVCLDILLGVKTRLEEILLTGIIRKTCHHVHVVDSSTMALDSLATHSFDLCLLSDQLSDITGVAVTQSIRSQNKEWSHVPIVGMLQENSQTLVLDWVQSGINSFICVPITQSKVLALLSYYQAKKGKLFAMP